MIKSITTYTGPRKEVKPVNIDIKASELKKAASSSGTYAYKLKEEKPNSKS